MSKVQEFMERIKSDVVLREQVTSLGEDMQAVLDIAKREGYNFTQAEFESALRDRGYEVGMELSEEDLAKVAGGVMAGGSNPGTCWPSC